MIFFVTMPKKIKALVEQISNYTTFEDYEVTLSKSAAFLYTVNTELDFEIKDPLPFTLAPHRMKSIISKSMKTCTKPISGKLQCSVERNQRRMK